MKQKSRRELKTTRRNSRDKKPATLNPLKISFGLIVLLYIFIPNFTPNWMTLDTNASKFMTTALLNLLSFVVLMFDNDLKRKPGALTDFFRSHTGLAFCGLLIITLLSFMQSINLIESALELTKLSTLFAAIYILSIIITYDIRFVRLIAFVLTGILIFDSVSVFYNIGEFINGGVARISDIKTVYSNKNILASAIYVKIPAALWLMLFEKRWLKWLGFVALFMGFLSTFFMATRTFYLGLIVATILFIVFAGYNYYREREKTHLIHLATYLIALMLALGSFSFVQKNLYPQSGRSATRHTQGVGEQLGTIVTGDTSTSIRLTAWKWSGRMIKQKPLLGVGAGNWKVAVLEYENQSKPNFIYAYKAHNDFLEVTAEKGIPGGLLFIAVFATILLGFLRLYFKQNGNETLYRTHFLAATGVFFYSIDAFFNFPGDRPEIVALFALYIATGIASANIQKESEKKEENTAPVINTQKRGPAFWGIFLAVMLAMASASYIFYQNFESSKLQRVVYQEIMSGTLKESSDRFVDNFPPIPNISHWGESISTLSARYLIQERKFNEALDAIRHDKLNPYDSRREYFMAICFHELEMPDSALYYSMLSYETKPMYFRNLHFMINLLEKADRNDEIVDYLNTYLEKDKTTNTAWILASNTYNRKGDLEKAFEVIEEAKRILPRDSLIDRQHRFLTFRKFIEPHRHLYNQALPFYQQGNYARALPLLNEYINKVPFEENVWRMRAICHYHLRQHQNCINDIERIFEESDSRDPSMLNLRGASYRGLGQNSKACEDFKASMEAGNANGIENFSRFCNS